MHRHCLGPVLLQQTRAEPHPAHRLSGFDQRHSRCCGRIRPADLHDDRAPRTRPLHQPTTRHAMACESSSPSSMPWASHIISSTQMRMSPRSHPRSNCLCEVPTRGAADRTPTIPVMMQRDQCLAVRRTTSRTRSWWRPTAPRSNGSSWESAVSTTFRSARWVSTPARAGPGVGPAGPARHLPARGRQSSDESRRAGHDRGGGTEEPRPFRSAERDVRSKWKPPHSKQGRGLRRHGPRSRVCACA